jgi:DNA-directed RNA polymerase subunit RPC12/RpoP
MILGKLTPGPSRAKINNMTRYAVFTMPRIIMPKAIMVVYQCTECERICKSSEQIQLVRNFTCSPKCKAHKISKSKSILDKIIDILRTRIW